MAAGFLARTLGGLMRPRTFQAGTGITITNPTGDAGDPTFSATNTNAGTVTATTGALTLSQLIIGNGGVDIKALGSLGTSVQVLHGNAAGNPSFAAIAMTTDVSDYEVGNWTPNLYFNFNATGLTYSLHSGTYVRIGNLVVLQGRVDLSAKGSSTGAALMNPLPFVESDSLANGCAFTYFGAFAAGVTTMLTGYVTTGFTLNLAYSVSTGITLLQDTDFTNGSAMIWTHIYRTS